MWMGAENVIFLWIKIRCLDQTGREVLSEVAPKCKPGGQSQGKKEGSQTSTSKTAEAIWYEHPGPIAPSPFTFAHTTSVKQQHSATQALKVQYRKRICAGSTI